MSTELIVSRFWEKVNKSKDGCWEWQASIDTKGYGYCWNGKKVVRAHRFSWELHFGPIPNCIQVLHSCDNPPCINPEHLFLGTNLDNVKDKCKKERQKKGEKHPFAILKDEQVIEIRRRDESGESLANISKEFNVTKKSISQVARGNKWKHIHISENAKRNRTVKLSKEQIIEIKQRYRLGGNQYVIAIEFGVTQAHVSNIIRGKKRKNG